MSDLRAWDQRTAARLEAAYVAAGAGPGGSGSTDPSEGAWRAKRQHLAVPMDADGTWLDVGCANGYLLATLPTWAAERGIAIEPHGLELLPAVADLARTLLPSLAERIWTGSVMSWTPPMRFRYVTVVDDVVPPARLGDLVGHLLHRCMEPGGRLIVSSYTNTGEEPRALVADLTAVGYRPDGVIHIDRPGRAPLLTVWLDA
ncbi:MAG TPA: hypothetical protein VK866_19915 [Acidimicrobiales bacterium]|nr:hypothetical protein [Acidimicrobiales bacterium]